MAYASRPRPAPRRQFRPSERDKSLAAAQMRLSDQLARLGRDLATIGDELPNEGLSSLARSVTTLATALKELCMSGEGSLALARLWADDLVKLGAALAGLSSTLDVGAEARGGDGRDRVRR